MNRLSTETSPYLLQHADNPVHWFPWGEQALNKAIEENKPILLSIGYSACHWCHVMAHESFEDEKTARVMNDLFINIKIDREERPDLDKIYQTAHSMLTDSTGGWPLTVFLNPRDHMPIFAGTYFPKQPRHGLPSFTQLLDHVHDIYQTRKKDIEKQSASLKDFYTRMVEQNNTSTENLNSLPLDVARNQIEQQFDSINGGYSGAPKFPHPTIISRAINHWARTSTDGRADSRILHTAIFTLERMSSGGLFDHLGGGFCRYSTDETWMIPHFEKMLYDNGPLLYLNTQAWCISGSTLFLDAATETADWVMREMQSTEGGYYSALDADSEGEEGKFYTWTPNEIKSLLDEDSYSLLEQRFGLDRNANFEDRWHLHTYTDYETLATSVSTTSEAVREQILTSRQQLFEAREKRIHPGRDDKVLTSWNGLMIQAMAHAGRILQREEYILSAEKAADFIKHNMWQNNRLLATSKDGKSHLNAYLDDYAFLLNGLLELLQSRWNSDHLLWAEQIADVMTEQFEDQNQGGFFFTSHDHEKLIQRTKNYADEAMPSGNGIAVQALLKLGYLTGKTHYLAAAERGLKAAWSSLSEHPVAHCSLLNALDNYLKAPKIIILRGADDMARWQNKLAGRYLSDTLVFSIPAETQLSGALADKKARQTTTAYVCENTSCQPPITSIEDYISLLNAATVKIKKPTK